MICDMMEKILHILTAHTTDDDHDPKKPKYTKVLSATSQNCIILSCPGLFEPGFQSLVLCLALHVIALYWKFGLDIQLIVNKSCLWVHPCFVS